MSQTSRLYLVFAVSRNCYCRALLRGQIFLNDSIDRIIYW